MHALTTHFSKGLIGSSKTAKLPTFRVCGNGGCGTRGVCNLGRCQCLPGQAVGSGSVEKSGKLGAPGTSIYNFNAQGTTTPTLEVRDTPLRPAVLGQDSVGPVRDVSGELREGDRLAICLEATVSDEKLAGACLGFYDQADGKWKCQDKCLRRLDDQVCGTTDHLTNFAVLLSGETPRDRGCKSEDDALWKRACGGLQLCEDGTCKEQCGTACTGTTPVKCPDGSCVGKIEECPK